jgi:hypothetical protein
VLRNEYSILWGEQSVDIERIRKGWDESVGGVKRFGSFAWAL